MTSTLGTTSGRSPVWREPALAPGRLGSGWLAEYLIVDGPDPGGWTGLDGLEKGARGRLVTAERGELVAEEYRELDNERVLVLIHRVARGKASGAELDPRQTEGATPFHIRDSKATKLVAYWERERALADLRLTR